MKNPPTTCHFLFHNTVLQSIIHRPNIINNFLIDLLFFHSCWIKNIKFRIQEKVLDPT